MSKKPPTKIPLGVGWPYQVSSDQLVIRFSRGSGNGGQKKQKTSSRCQMTHIPTGLSVVCEETRSAHENRKIAFRKLAEKLVPIMKEQIRLRDQIAAPVASTPVRVRTYHLPDQRVNDERLDKLFSYDDVLEGDGLSDIIDALILNYMPK